jgi:phosphoglycerate dehydrogenase-like enzyme
MNERMATRKKFIATEMKIPRRVTAQVSKASHGTFEVRGLQSIQASRRDDVEVLVLGDSKLVTRKLFEDFRNTKLLQSVSAGVDFIDFNAIPSQVTVCSNAGAYSEPIAEHVFGMILYFAKHLNRNHERIRAGIFGGAADGMFLGGKTIGVVGAGGIGQSVARIAKAFNMRTIGINTSGRAAPNFDTAWKMDRLEDLLAQSDIVVLSLPLNIHTKNLIDGKKLRLMKEDAILVNIARGPIISQADLYAHLKAHPEFRTGIDVWWAYPRKGEKLPVDFPFLELPNFLGSPHNADGVPNAREAGQVYAFENVLRFIGGRPIERVVDKTSYAGFRRTPRG